MNPAQDQGDDMAATLARQALMFDTILSSITDFAYIFDREGRFIYANKPLLDLWGIGLEAAVGKNFFDLRYPPELAEKLQRQIRQVFETGRRLVDETSYTSPTGSGGFYEYIFTPVFSAEGVVETVAGSTRDITDRKKSEQALAESQRRLQTLFDNTQDAILLTDDDARYVDVNPAACELTGYNRDELLQRSVWDITPVPNRETGERLWREFIASGRQGGEYTLARKDGSLVSVEYRAVASILPGLHLSVLRDVTERSRAAKERERLLAAEQAARAEAEQANQAQTRFLAVLSHELRTPLTPVLTTVQMMESDATLPPEVAEQITMMRRNIELEARLIDDLLDLTRVSQGKLELQLATVDLHDKIRHVIGICNSDVRSRQLHLDVDLQADPHHVRGEGGRLQQVLWNLLKNAIKFTPAGGTITVRTATGPDQRVMMTVADTGIGIEPAALPRIFDAFEQGGREVTRMFGGLGLGLSISKALVDLHAGTLVAESAGHGRGATFTMTLPAVAPPAATAAPVGKSQALRDNCRILLVEDHADTARATARLLSRTGCDVRIAASVAGALQAMEAETFDLVISDIGLPDGSGLDLMRQLRAKHPVKGIALSGYGMPEDIDRSNEAGFDFHLTKPVDLRRLEEVVRQILG
jgi:PAS domain S-box-containing protein